MTNEVPQSAFNELNIVQSIITTQEELVFKVGSWAIGLITALTIALFNRETLLPWGI